VGTVYTVAVECVQQCGGDIFEEQGGCYFLRQAFTRTLESG
jgi:hypothetical protein